MLCYAMLCYAMLCYVTGGIVTALAANDAAEALAEAAAAQQAFIMIIIIIIVIIVIVFCMIISTIYVYIHIDIYTCISCVYIYIYIYILQPFTIRYCQDDLCMFRVSLIAAVRCTALKTRRHIHLVMEKPRTTSQEARPPNDKSPNLSSETDPGLRSATPMLTQRQQHTCTRRAELKFSIGGHEAIRQYFIVRGGSYLDLIL